MGSEAAIKLEKITKRYGDGAQCVTALSGIDLRVARGQFVSVMGPSGCGKSTLLNLIAGLDAPTSGRVVVAGQDLTRLSDNQRSDLRLQKIGVVFQGFNLFPTLTVEENVAWPLQLLGLRWREARRRAAALGRVELGPAVAARRPSELSGGEAAAGRDRARPGHGTGAAAHRRTHGQPRMVCRTAPRTRYSTFRTSSSCRPDARPG